jgi:ribosomal protein S18 acetylase RimI-like enzyme
MGKTAFVVSSTCPINLDWIIPGTPGHEHNNMPGMDEECPGFPFLKNRGYAVAVREVAMYLNLDDYVKKPEVEEKRAALQEQGIVAGLYDVAQNAEFDGMCDRVGSEYWRNVLKQEIAAWHEDRPNSDPDLWVDGIKPEGPRPILVAVKDGHIIGFTGPVGRQLSGRGWFTGICVDPNFGGRSIGTVLFNMLMVEFQKVGAGFSSLFTGTSNHAQKIYLRAGFEPRAHWAVMRFE